MSLLSDLGLDLGDGGEQPPPKPEKEASKPEEISSVTLTTDASSTATSTIDDLLGLSSSGNGVAPETSAKSDPSSGVAQSSTLAATKTSTSPSRSVASLSSSGGLSDSGDMMFNLLPDMNEHVTEPMPDRTNTASELHAVSSPLTAELLPPAPSDIAPTTEHSSRKKTTKKKHTTEQSTINDTGDSSAKSSGGSWSSWRSSLRQKFSEAANSDFAASVSSKLTRVASTTKESAFSIATYLQSSGDPEDDGGGGSVMAAMVTSTDDPTLKSGEIAEVSKLVDSTTMSSTDGTPSAIPKARSVADMVTATVEKQANDLGMYYITEDKRIVAMEYPSDETILSGTKLGETLSQVVADSTADTFATSQPSQISSDKSGSTTSSVASYLTSKVASTLIPSSKAEKISRYLKKNHVRHGSSFMIWNLSEVNYTRRMQEVLFDNSVLDFKFPGYPCPPLQQLFEILASIQNWLNASETNIALIHCQTGKGRTVTVISAYLAWAGLIETPAKALLHTVSQMNGTVKSHTIPSQTRYLAYLTQLLVEKQKPLDRPIVIERILVHGIPYFEISKNSAYHATRAYLREKHRQWESGDDSMTAGKIGTLDTPTATTESITVDTAASVDASAVTASSSADPMSGSTEDQSSMNPSSAASESATAKRSPKKRKRVSLLDGTDLSDEEEEDDEEEELELGATAVVGSPKSPSPMKPEKPAPVITKPTIPRPPVLRYTPTKDDMGFRPYIQIFKDAKLVWSSRTDAKREYRKRMKKQESEQTDSTIPSASSKPSSSSSRKKISDVDILDFYDQSDRVVKFSVGGTSGGSCPPLDGDMLVRIRHICCSVKSAVNQPSDADSAGDSANGRKVSVCRFSFHTGYIAENGLIRFRKSQLDGAWNSDRFPADFSIDLITGVGPDPKSNIISTNGGLKDIVVTASFWDDIDRHHLTGQSDERRLKRLEYEKNRDQRRKEEKQRKKEQQKKKQSESTEKKSEDDGSVDLLGIGLSSGMESETTKEIGEQQQQQQSKDDSDGPAVLDAAEIATVAAPKFTLGAHEEEEVSLDHSSEEEDGDGDGEEKAEDTMIHMNDENVLFGDGGSHLDELEAMAEQMELGSDDEDLLNELEAIAADDSDELLP